MNFNSICILLIIYLSSVYHGAFCDLKCGLGLICKSSKRNSFSRIIGGNIASAGEFPWMLSLSKFQKHHCGATIIDKEWAITAAHCVNGFSTLEMVIVAGSLYLYQADPKEQVVQIQAIYVHPDYEQDGQAHINDIALLKLQQPLNFTKFKIGPVCLPQKDQEPPGTCLLAGWGHTKEDGELSQALRKVNVPLITAEECQRHYLFHSIRDSMQCTWSEQGGRDSCQGDSGGPLLCLNKDRRYYIAGIVSWGVGCGRPSFPGICTKVSSFLPWIENTMNKNL